MYENIIAKLEAFFGYVNLGKIARAIVHYFYQNYFFTYFTLSLLRILSIYLWDGICR